jgi:hypothetical protein
MVDGKIIIGKEKRGKSMRFGLFKKKKFVTLPVIRQYITSVEVQFQEKSTLFPLLKFCFLFETGDVTSVIYHENSKKSKWLLKNNNKQIQVYVSYKDPSKYSFMHITYIEPVMIEYNNLRCPKCGRFWNPTKGKCICKERKEDEF